MKAELGRKITSLTLMTIMFAGALTFAIPGAMPAAEGETKLLFVSAESEEFANQFKGAQIVEIIVQDPIRADTDVAEGEPVVEVNGDTLRMAQGSDGYWYAYIADTAGVVAILMLTLTSTLVLHCRKVLILQMSLYTQTQLFTKAVTS